MDEQVRRTLSIKEVAEVTGLAVQTLYNLRHSGEGPASFLLRRRVRYYLADVETWIASHAGASNVTPIGRRAASR
ncbi:helix-turn-helix domain-containing protein [Agromyces atrinae]|uniref:helix-turn-helix transcriptional regulator n=1 Tax=Agromyces atrinae TaxID=592376 RepID=UPI001F55AE74|nr:helix-turn-helix domain-containing protein [Agromyces atrinae]MCI2959515.1 helix-turn-helix domain-containing protein [Agromyces atrinae]